MRASTGAAFTLVELLAVMGIIVILLGLILPAVLGRQGSGDLTKAAYDIAGTLDQARAYAMANNTYVFVGLAEVDSSVSDSTAPQSPASGSIGGRVAVAVVASRDGTRGYDVNNPSTSWANNYASGAKLVAISKLQRVDNMHIVDFGDTPPATGNMVRAAIADPAPAGSSPNCRLGNSSSVSVTPFIWPLGSPLTGGTPLYTFSKVINIDPQGVARLQGASNADSIPQWMEIGLQPTHGNVVPPAPAAQTYGIIAAIQIDAMSGGVRIFKP